MTTWLRLLLLVGAAYLAGLMTYWVIASGAKEAPDGFNIVGFVVSLLATVLAWRIFELQSTNQAAFEKSQGEVLGNVQAALSEIREIARATKGQVQQQVLPAIDEMRRQSLEQVTTTLATTQASMSRAQEELAAASQAPTENESSAVQAAVAQLQADLATALTDLEAARAHAAAAEAARRDTQRMTFDELARLLEPVRTQRDGSLRATTAAAQARAAAAEMRGTTVGPVPEVTTKGAFVSPPARAPGTGPYVLPNLTAPTNMTRAPRRPGIRRTTAGVAKHRAPEPGSPRAVVYVRVSTAAQEDDGTSLETQERRCLEHAAA
jgi:hypothetical protein